MNAERRATVIGRKDMWKIGAVMLLLLCCFAAFAAQPAERRFVAVVDDDGVQRVRMIGGEYYFDPNIVEVKVNVPVELHVKKAGGVAPHDIVLKAPEAGIDVAEELDGTEKIISFTPTKTGSYPFECSKRFLFFESHKEQGMHGVLEVVE
ncbi:MAG: cupredoxin domain-containing protein [Desulfobulbaceae bacterium]